MLFIRAKIVTVLLAIDLPTGSKCSNEPRFSGKSEFEE